MELKWLEDFLALAETNSFSKAAEERSITQSAFSRRIKQLEIWLGSSLIDRATYPSRLTGAGEKFVPVAREAVRSLTQARRSLREQEGVEAQTITVTALHTLSFTFFPSWLRAVSDMVGPLLSRIKPDLGSMEENVSSLVDGDCDFLLTYAHPSVSLVLDPEQFEYRILDHETIVPISAPSSDGKPLHDPDRIRPASYVGYEKGSFFGRLLGEVLSERLAAHKRAHTGSMSVGLKGMALAGWGVAWVPESLIRTELDNGTLVRAGDTSWDIRVDIRLYRSRQNRRPIVNRIWLCTGNGSTRLPETALPPEDVPLTR